MDYKNGVSSYIQLNKPKKQVYKHQKKIKEGIEKANFYNNKYEYIMI